MIQTLRRKTAGAIAGSDALYRSFARIALDERLLGRLLEDKILLHRFTSNESLRLGLQTLLLDENLLRGTVFDERFLPKVFDVIARDGGAAKRFARSEGVRRKLAREPEVQAQVLAEGGIAAKIIAKEALLREVLLDARAREYLDSQTAILDAVLDSRKALDRIVANTNLLGSLLGDPRSVKRILAEREFLIQMLWSNEAFSALMGSEPLLRRIISQKSARAALAGDADLAALTARELLLQPAVAERVFTDAGAPGGIFQDPSGRMMPALLKSPGLRQAILRDDALATEIVVERLVKDSALLTGVLSAERIAKGVAKDRNLCAKILFEEGGLNEGTLAARAQAVFAFRERLKSLAAHTDQMRPGFADEAKSAEAKLRGPGDVEARVMDVLCNGNEIRMAAGVMEFTDRNSAQVLLGEIFVNEDYFFEASSEEPLILDCGANAGFAICYFKSLYPKARIRAFEPVPAIFAMAKRNIERNGWGSVELLPHALAAQEGTLRFNVSKQHAMAGSLTDRRREFGDEVEEIQVEAKRLSDYLKESVDLLKLDIEGVEDEVLAEAAESLRQARNIFVEYHHGAGLRGDRLTKILALLDQQGFDYHLGKSPYYERVTGRRPLSHAAEPYSLNIWAKRRD